MICVRLLKLLARSKRNDQEQSVTVGEAKAGEVVLAAAVLADLAVDNQYC